MAATLALSVLVASASVRADEPPPSGDVEGAVGLLMSNGPAYPGADERSAKVLPGFFLRWGRLSITNASGFVTRRNDEVVRGLGLDLNRSDTFRVSLGLRFDNGRSESDSEALRGLGNIRSTVRARLALQWRPDAHWLYRAAWSVDAFGRGGGNFGETSIAREQRVSPATTWTVGGGFSLAGDRYLQTYYGVNEAQSARTGYPVYTPGFGLRDASLFANMRSELNHRWVALGGISATRLLGPAADSPLTRKASNVAVNAGLAWNF